MKNHSGQKTELICQKDLTMGEQFISFVHEHF
mgnify:CR=1 FL=1